MSLLHLFVIVSKSVNSFGAPCAVCRVRSTPIPKPESRYKTAPDVVLLDNLELSGLVVELGHKVSPAVGVSQCVQVLEAVLGQTVELVGLRHLGQVLVVVPVCLTYLAGRWGTWGVLVDDSR